MIDPPETYTYKRPFTQEGNYLVKYFSTEVILFTENSVLYGLTLEFLA